MLQHVSKSFGAVWKGCHMKAANWIRKLILPEQSIDRNLKRCVLLFLFSVMIGSFIEYAGIFELDTFWEVRTSSKYNKECRMEDAEFVNCKETKEGVVTQNNDAQIIFHNVDSYVGFVELKLQKALNHAWDLHIYYGKQEQGFCEENSIMRWVSKYENRVIVKIGQEITDLRMNFGCEPDVEFCITQIQVNPSCCDYLLSVFQNFSKIRVFIYAVGIFLSMLCIADAASVWEFLFRYRWIFGIIVILACTVFKIHGSSMGSYLVHHGLPGYDYGKLFGKYRSIRSDEYVVFTPMALSQVREGFPWFGENFRYSLTDMFIVYGQPVKSLLMAYRPFQLGYLLFGAEMGLAFYWTSRLVICFLVSLEFGRILTKDDRKLSVAYAFLVAFSPILQWWFSINALAEMLIWGQLAVILLDKYLCTHSWKRKIVYMAGLVICAGGYILTLYPSWEIPIFYVFLSCAVARIAEKRKAIKIHRVDICICAAGILILTVSMASVFLRSLETIQAVTNTIYPGERDISGDSLSMLPELLRGWSSALWGLIDIQNPCEKVGFIDFFPCGIVLSIFLVIGMKKKDCWMISLNIINLILISFMIMPWPYILTKITLLNQVTPIRMTMAVGMVNLMILFRALSEFRIKKRYLILIGAGTSLFTAIYSVGCVNEFESPKMRMVVICIVLICCAVVFLMNEKRKKWILGISVILGIVGGGMVNPVNKGLDLINDNPIVRNIEAINNESRGKWAVDMDSIVFNSLPAMAGAESVNTVQTYPDYAMWEKIGLKDDIVIWNRYAHIDLRMVNEKGCDMPLELLGVDHIRLRVSISNLKKISVKYVLSNQDLCQADGIRCLYQYGGYYIYELL